MTTSESKGQFFYKMNRFESIQITNRLDSNRELECSRSRSDFDQLSALWFYVLHLLDTNCVISEAFPRASLLARCEKN